MMATLHDTAFDSDEYIYEIKWDGYRAIAEIDNGKVKLYSRNGLSFEYDFPAIYDELSIIPGKAILDGELVALDDEGIPSFQLLQRYLKNEAVPLVYYVFDLLSIDGNSIGNKPLTERKNLLENLLPKSDIIRYCDHVADKGIAFFQLMKERGLEGMIAKRKDSSYRRGYRSKDWLKVKNLIEEEAVIVGYTEGRNSRKHFGALVLGAYDDDGKLVYIGHTGTGFDDKTLKYVYDCLQPLVTKEYPFEEKVKVNAPVTWVKPELVCNLKFTEKTHEGLRRHPVFLGLRDDKSAKETNAAIIKKQTEQTRNPSNKKTREIMPDKAVKENMTVNKVKLQFSNLDKVYWPDEGYTKGALITYYNTMYKYVLPYLKGRPLSLLRNPNGIDEKGFFQKDAGEHVPDWVQTEEVQTENSDKKIDYYICNNRQTLLYLANLGCIEMNPWFSTIQHLEQPDYLVLDIDPSEKNTFNQVIDTALVIKEILDKSGADCYCKTSGSTGLHIYVPLGARYDFDHARKFAEIVAHLAQEQLPGFTSLERSLAKRGKNKIYIDYLQNRIGQTLASPYSVRPKPGAPVSTPLDWKEVKHGLSISDFTINNVSSRVEKIGDIFKPVLGKAIDMQKCIENLEQ